MKAMKERIRMYAVKISGPKFGSVDVYWNHPGGKRRAVFDSKAEAKELAEREGGYVVEVRR